MRTLSLRMLIAFLTLPMLAGCSLIAKQYWRIARRAEWNEVAKSGGIKVGTPYLERGRWHLPVECRASRNTSFPTYYAKANVRVRNSEILFYFYSRTDEEKFQTEELKVIVLPKLPEGDYRVAYLNSDGSREFLTQVSLK